MATEKVTFTYPSADTPIITRDRRITPEWYPLFQKIAAVSEGLSTGNLILDGAITTGLVSADAITADLIATGAVTADAMAANSITVGNAALSDAVITTAKIATGAITNAKISAAQITAAHIVDATITSAKIGTAEIETLNIDGNAVTQAVSASAPTQVGFSSSTYSTIESVTATFSGNQPVLVWGTVSYSGAENVTPPGDYTYDGLDWQTNASTSYVTLRSTISGGYTSNEVEEFSVLAGETHPLPFAFLFSSVASGTRDVDIDLKLTSGSGIGVRDITLAVLETKR